MIRFNIVSKLRLIDINIIKMFEQGNIMYTYKEIPKKCTGNFQDTLKNSYNITVFPKSNEVDAVEEMIKYYNYFRYKS